MTWTNQSGTGSTLHEVFFLDNLNGYAAGEVGTCLKTTDGGNSWTPLSLNTGNGKVSIFFNNVDTGYVVGAGLSDAILKTSDGGTNWASIYSNSPEELGSIYFTNYNTGYVVSTVSSSVIKTTDAGNNWSSSSPNVSGGLYSIKFPSDNIGFIVGGYPNNSSILYTNDAGVTWSNQTSSVSDPLFDVFFIDNNIGYAVGMNGSIIKTVNGSVGINEELQTSFIKVYPNPTIDFINIELETKQNIERIIVSDITGNEIINKTNISNNEINVTSLRSGSYLVHIYSEQKVFIKKIIKK